ncbi:hypothetical protein BT96DRAFT_224185 [Gymnopus androsaceus JB14]|uniref:Uncharacterized protein n=1 Tax=Gymnopus androsaceus JB14 TaxID=1447944 RepID=A0A6A4I9G8_9AGAR|nr:hypothetical protein BT96DRAFT_224185 [Gymnopus androsaceus JB14]
MRMDLHHSFDAGVFFLLPAIIVLRKIVEFSESNASKTRTSDKRKFYEVFSDTTWSYHLFTASFDPNRSIHRRNVDTSTRIPDIIRHPDSGGYTEHSFPFNTSDMQNLKCHVHPFFVTANAYLHMRKLNPQKRDRMMRDNEALQLVWKIGNIWLQPVPASFKDTKKGGANAMRDPKKDSVSFLADTDNQGKVKYQKKEVFYQHLMVWADERRSFEHVFSNPSLEGTPEAQHDVEMADAQPELPRRRTRSATMSQWNRTEDISFVPATSRMRTRGYDVSKSPAAKKQKLALPTSPPSPRSLRGKKSPQRTHLEPAIQSYPTSFEIEVEDGTNLLMDFISSQITILRKDPRGSLSADADYSDGDIADIAFEVLERQIADEDAKLAGSPKAEKGSSKISKSTPPKPSPVETATPSSRPRSSTLRLSHIEIPRLVSLSTSQTQKKDSKGNSRNNRSMTVESHTDVEMSPVPLPASFQRGKSVSPDTPKVPLSSRKPIVRPTSKPKCERFSRALSTPLVSRSSSSALMARFSTKNITRDSEEGTSYRRIKSSPSTLDMSLKSPSRSISAEAPTLISSPTATKDDGTTFLRAGQQAIFKALADEFGLSVNDVSGVYSELEDLEKTRRILSKLSRPAEASLTNSKIPHSPRDSFPGAPPKPSATPKRKLTRSQSVAPASFEDREFSSPRMATRAFLSAPRPRPTRSFPVLSFSPSDSGNNDADGSESDEVPEWKERRLKQNQLRGRDILVVRTGSSATSLKLKSSSSPVFKRSSPTKSKKDVGLGEQGWNEPSGSSSVPESRLDSLTRSIELILRSATR